MDTPAITFTSARRFDPADAVRDTAVAKKQRRFVPASRFPKAGEPPMNLVQAYLRTIRDARG